MSISPIIQIQKLRFKWQSNMSKAKEQGFYLSTHSFHPHIHSTSTVLLRPRLGANERELSRTNESQ